MYDGLVKNKTQKKFSINIHNTFIVPLTGIISQLLNN